MNKNNKAKAVLGTMLCLLNVLFATSCARLNDEVDAKGRLITKIELDLNNFKTGISQERALGMMGESPNCEPSENSLVKGYGENWKALVASKDRPSGFDSDYLIFKEKADTICISSEKTQWAGTDTTMYITLKDKTTKTVAFIVPLGSHDGPVAELVAKQKIREYLKKFYEPEKDARVVVSKQNELSSAPLEPTEEKKKSSSTIQKEELYFRLATLDLLTKGLVDNKGNTLQVLNGGGAMVFTLADKDVSQALLKSIKSH